MYTIVFAYKFNELSQTECTLLYPHPNQETQHHQHSRSPLKLPSGHYPPHPTKDNQHSVFLVLPTFDLYIKGNLEYILFNCWAYFTQIFICVADCCVIFFGSTHAKLLLILLLGCLCFSY